MYLLIVLYGVCKVKVLTTRSRFDTTQIKYDAGATDKILFPHDCHLYRSSVGNSDVSSSVRKGFLP